MGAHKIQIKSYADVLEFMQGKQERPYAHNTRIESNDGFYTVTYHGNPIVEIHPDKIVLSSCGWKNLTTKERLNWFIPEGYSVYQERGGWYIRNWEDDSTIVFQDGITFHSDNTVSNYGDVSEKDRIKALTKQVKKYVKGYIESLISGDIESPGSGDCWYCCGDDGITLGDKTKSDHLESHLEESYYVPSLLYNACQEFGASLFVKSLIGNIWNDENYSISDWEGWVLERDLTSILTRYMKRHLGIAA